METLKRLWRDGLSARQIAGALGGVTRNAVIGKVHRLGLSGTRPAAPRPPKVRRAAARRPARPVRAPARDAPAILQEELPGLAGRLEDLCLRACRWPIGDPKADDFAFCGRRAEGGPYCALHARRAFRPERMRPAEARALLRLLRAA